MYKKAPEFTRRIAETRKESEKKEGGGYQGGTSALQSEE